VKLNDILFAFVALVLFIPPFYTCFYWEHRSSPRHYREGFEPEPDVAVHENLDGTRIHAVSFFLGLTVSDELMVRYFSPTKFLLYLVLQLLWLGVRFRSFLLGKVRDGLIFLGVTRNETQIFQCVVRI